MSPLHPIATILILALLLAASAPASSAIISVAQGVTQIAADGECSLAEAINNANANAQVNNADCVAGDPGVDTIVLASGSIYVLDTALPVVTSQIQIEGNGSVLERNDFIACVPDGTLAPGEFRILTQLGGFLQVRDLTLSNGCADGAMSASSDGAGIRVDDGTLTLIRVVIKNNLSWDKSGAIDATNAIVEIIDSILRNNHAGFGGGAIGNDTTATMTISGSTFANNTASGFGGAGIGNRGTMSVVNSTISGNISMPTEAGGGGGGIGNSGDLTLVNVTITGNSDSGGGGVGGGGIANAGTVTIRNSIVANSSSGGDCVSVMGTFSAVDENLDTDGSCNALDAGFTTTTTLALALEPLADNGGPTPTHRPGSGSPANDAIATCLSDGNELTVDQRGFPRPRAGGCDLGALEGIVATLSVEVTGPGVVDAGALPAPESGGVTGCDESGSGQAACTAVYVEGSNEGITLDLAPDPGSAIDSISGCDGQLAGTSYTIDRLNTDCTVTVVFAPVTDDIFADNFEG